jgi:hypothetical protein
MTPIFTDAQYRCLEWLEKEPLPDLPLIRRYVGIRPQTLIALEQRGYIVLLDGFWTVTPWHKEYIEKRIKIWRRRQGEKS